MAGPATRRKVVIIGAGFGGLAAAKGLAGAACDVTVIDRHNYHLFQPLLYQVATAGLSPSDIASPIRAILRDCRNVNVVLAEVSGIDVAQSVVLAEGRKVPFDDLIVATGAQHSYFGNDAWAALAPGLKTIDDATDLRRRILLAFEKAETEPDAESRRRLLTFVIIGAGPTGVEMAGAVAELAKRALAKDFRMIDPAQARIILVEAGSRVLAAFAPDLSEAAAQALVKMGVELRLASAVTAMSPQGVLLGGDLIETETVMWAAGVKASPAGRWLGAATDRAGRTTVGTDLSVPGHPHIFAIGDTAHAVGADGKPLPGVAAVAKQQGEYVAALLRARAAGNALPAFAYRNYGSMATIGRKRAVAQFDALSFHGFFAWVLWCVAHVYFLIGFRNRLAVTMNWVWNYVTFQRGTRLITGLSGSMSPMMKAAADMPMLTAPMPTAPMQADRNQPSAAAVGAA